MEIRRIFSLLSPVKSRIAFSLILSENYAYFILQLINKRLISLIPLFCISGITARRLHALCIIFLGLWYTRKHLSIASTGFTHNPPFSLGETVDPESTKGSHTYP